MKARRNTAQENRWLSEGEEAAKAGKTKDDCPHQFNLRARSAWLIGWTNHDNRLKWADERLAATARNAVIDAAMEWHRAPPDARRTAAEFALSNACAAYAVAMTPRVGRRED